MGKSIEAPWVAGLRAAKANVIPALVMQASMVALLAAYYLFPPTTRWLNNLAALKGEWGYGFSALAAVIAGALIPEMMRVCAFQKGKLSHTNFLNLIATIPFWGFNGIVVDLLYRSFANWFGTEVSFQVVATKVLLDQLVFGPLYASPTSAWFYDWKNNNYSFMNTRRFFTKIYYREVIVPTIFAGWAVWVPVVTIIYSLPSLLQIPLFALALAMWVILYTWISEARAGMKFPTSS